MCPGSSNRTLRLYCRIKQLMVLLRKHPHLNKAQFRLLSPPHPSIFTRRAIALNHTGTSRCLAVRLYSSSNRDVLKAEAPIGLSLEEARTSSRPEWNSLGGRVGQSFGRLSKHINDYFRRKELLVVPLAENASLVVATQEFAGRSPRRRARERSACEDKGAPQVHESTESSAKDVSPTQLFHISSLATRFGESYSYVANHVNSVFSRSFSKAQLQETMPSTRGRQRRKKITVLKAKGEKASVEQAPVESKDPSGRWEEGYLLLARHINSYFGAKATNEIQEKTQSSSSSLKREEPAAVETGGLFHSSHSANPFGENYVQTANHINEFFSGEPDEETDGEVLLSDSGSVTSETLERSLTFLDCLRHPTSAIPELLGSYLRVGSYGQTQKTKVAVMSPQAVLNRKLVLSSRRSEEITRGLMGSLRLASSPVAVVACVEALNEHLLRYPQCKALMWQEKSAVTLLRQRRTYRNDHVVQSALRESLALIGYVNPVKGCGIRVLSIDGGGTRGVVPLQVLKLLEEETGRKIHQLFDYICGVSTGAVLAFMLGLARYSLEECADMYRRFGSEVFRQNPLVGTMKMGWTHSYYNTETWETILREKLGTRVLIKTARDEQSPKVSAVSAVVNWGTSPKAFVFRNYNHTPGSLSRYAGGSGHELWEAVRASSAAPGYFREFTLQSDIHQDGGIILNNPCALAVHESRLLWPGRPFQCVLSLGTGRYDNAKRGPATSTSLRAKIGNLICSATDTEGVHTLLDELLAPDVYFRFNPMLDESRPGALDGLQRDTLTYLERNRPKLARLCLVLGAERTAVSRTRDWMGQRAWEMRQRWM